MSKNLCPNCKKNTLSFRPATIQDEKEKRKEFELGFYVCRNCGWKSDFQDIGHKSIPKKKEMWLHQTYDKSNKRLLVWVYEQDPSQQDYNFYGEFIFGDNKIHITTTKDVDIKKITKD
jgi:protein-arginine kinase activator protein McsA